MARFDEKIKMDDSSKRDILILIAVIVIIVPLTFWLMTALDRLVALTDPIGPPTKARPSV
jgi:hypothetical protein